MWEWNGDKRATEKIILEERVWRFELDADIAVLEA